ncbi:hypothetical protein ACSBR2_033211 [Camellia fascicularis]
MTITPNDFSMLTGLRVGVGDSILFDPNMIQWKAAQLYLLGQSQMSLDTRWCSIASSWTIALRSSQLLQMRLHSMLVGSSCIFSVLPYLQTGRIP